MRKISSVPVCVMTVVVTAGCQAPPDGTDVGDQAGAAAATEPAVAPVVPPETLPLVEIMRALEEDLAEATHGLWVDDRTVVAAAAGRIAEHPRVTAEQMGVIQQTLGDEFPAFAGMDQRVHDGAVALAGVAGSATPVELMAQLVEVQGGCLACHVSFRARVSEALADGR